MDNTKNRFKNKNADKVLPKLKNTIRLNNDDRVSFEKGSEVALLGVLADSIYYNEKLTKQRRFFITQRAVVNIVKRSDQLTKENIGHETRKLEKTYLKQREKPLIIATTLSIRYFDELNSIRLDDAHITFSRRFPIKFEHIELARNLESDFRYPSNYTSVRVRVSERDNRRALEIAENNLDLIRSIWNLFLHTGYKQYTSGITPYSIIVSGPAFTIHHLRGKPAERQCWYSEQVSASRIPKDIQGRYPELKKFERKTRSCLKQADIGPDIKLMLLMYIRALDRVNRNSSYLALWSVLEKLTDSSNYDTTIKRATFIFRDTALAKLKLGYIRSCRNELVHDGSEYFAPEHILNELKLYVEQLLHFLIRNAYIFKTMEEFGGFLNLPACKDQLLRKKKHIDLANRLYIDN